MKIIRQDKKGHYDYKDVEIKESTGPTGTLEGYTINLVNSGFNNVILGGYSTEEKALKVMEMISNHYATEETLRLVKLDMAVLVNKRFEGFKMPLDDEVEV